MKRIRLHPQRSVLQRGIGVLVLVLMMAGALLQPAPAHAQQLVSDIADTAVSVAKYIGDKLQSAAKEVYSDAAAVSYYNTVGMFLNNLAVESANWIASGDEGQKPLLFTKDWGSYLQNAGENAVANVAIEFAQRAGLGNICVSPNVAIDIILPSLGGVAGTKPKCSLDQLKKSWDVRDPKFLENFTLSFQTNQNDLGVAVSFLETSEISKEAAEKAAEKSRDKSSFKDVKEKITDLISSPAPLVEQNVKDLQYFSTSYRVGVYTGRLVGDAIKSFTSTLAGQYLKKLQSGFFSLRDLADEDALSKARNSILDISSTPPSGSDAATANFSGVFKADIQQVNDFNIVSEMVQCPAEVKNAGIFNCVLDAGFASAVQASGEQRLLTVRDAVTRGFLHGDWAFGFTDPGSGVEPSYLNGYGYSNMKKLRRARIIPVGWELAALKARQISKRVTLQEVIDGFNDQSSPFFHLVDPNWVLKVPESRCTARAPGQILQSGGAERFSTCADIQDCVVKGSDGQCQTWGYCTNEKRTWSFPAASCPAEFATCDQYIDKDGEGGDDNLWLAKTMEYKGCSAQSAGCTWYALAKNSAGEWRDDDRVYLNRNAKECDAEDAGCHRYIRMVSGTNLLRNASFEDDGGHNYVLGAGDSTADNGTPDGWSSRGVTVSLDTLASSNGTNAARLLMQTATGANCAPALLYTTPIGSFEVAQQYTISGQVRTDSPAPRKVRLTFQGINFPVDEVSTDWKPFAFTFVMPATTTTYTLALGANDGDCGSINASTSIFYDAVQLEKGVKANTYRDYAATNVVQLKKAPTCSFEDVGCLNYKADDDVTSTSVNAVATGANLCPQECDGYNTFEQQPVDAEPARFSNFIPKTARECSAEQVGCQEYTNIDEVNRGGEGLQYYSQIRHCVQPEPQCGTYYAWEGSEQSGYQLMTFNVKASNANGSGTPLMVDNSTSCDPNDTNCRELIDRDGNRFRRDLRKTIICSEQCVPLRAGPNTTTQTECANRLGTWDSQSQRCVFNVLPSESRSCPAQFNGCREYVGNTGKNVAVLFSETFEDGDTNGWSSGVISTESTTVGGHSMKLGDSAGSINTTSQIAIDKVVANKGYELELSVKSSVPDLLTVTIWLGNGKVDANRLGGFVTGTRNWNQYKVGPLKLPTNTTLPANLIIEVRGSTGRSEVVSLFVDNVVLRQIKDSAYLVKDSWKTPAVCETDPPLTGGSAGRSMLGCRAYTVSGVNGVSAKTYVTGFARLCAKEKVGCEAVLDTFNSKVPYRQVFQEGDVAERVVSEDQVRFIVNRPEFACQSEQVGCMELGKPIINAEGNVTGHESKFLINNPDQYAQTLCKAAGLFCKEFSTSSGSIVYAKHPGAQQCEYREVANSFPTRFAWFKVGDTEEDPAECLDATLNSFVLRCPAEEISCNEWYEPITKESFYYRRNTLKNRSAECKGVVDWKNGCVAFDNKSDQNHTFKSGEVVDVVGAPDPCQTNDIGCNTNEILKVNLDRSCSQWLTGLSTSRFWDRNTQQFRTTSYGLGRCIQADPINPNICRVWDNDADKPLLTESVYKTRDVSWAGQDYSGYSIPNQFPAETLRQRSVGTDEDGNPSGFRLTRLTNEGQTCTATTSCPGGQVCRLSLNVVSGNFEGHCYVETGLDGNGASAAALCRGYPEEDSPFPSRLAVFAPHTDEKNPDQIITRDQQFKNANIGQNGEDVECSYHKAYYGAAGSGLARYYGITSIPPASIKIDGEESRFARKDTFIGWNGYCLEKDPSRIINGKQDEFACLTWYPVDVIQGALDFNNSSLKAGYVVPNDRETYCVESAFAEYRRFFASCEASCPNGYNLARRAESSTCANGRHRRFCEPVSGDGWYVYDGQLNGFEGNYGIQQMCTKAARISSADGHNRAWTTRILGTKLPGAKIYFVDELGWGPQQQNAPYGAARTLAPRLEDLPQPLIVRDPNTFVDNCQKCTLNEGDPFGTCEDDAPERKGRKCPIGPNAGSPYALMADNPSSINDTNVKVRRDNKLPEDEAQPYPKSENFTAGFRRVEQLFARSYGVYQWQSVQNVCVGSCQGGLSDGEACESDNACGDPDPAITYTCVGDPFGRTQGTCIGGYKDSQTCAVNGDCQAPRSNTIHQCTFVTGPDQDPNNPTFVCASGPFQGRTCTSIDDCDENKADGVCSYERRCQAKDASGTVTLSVNSGKACSTSEQCNSDGVCRVNRCSTEGPGTNSGLCTGKKAGDTCGSLVTGGVSQYTRIPANNTAVGWDLVLRNPAAAQQPIIRPTVADAQSPSGFNEGSITGFSVNGSTGGILSFNSGRAPVTVSFYTYNENGEQMPLRVLMVDWGDGSDPAESRGAFPNHKHLCRKFCSNANGVACTFDQECQSDADPKATCQPLNFGDADESCIGDSGTNNGYFAFSYTYTCEGTTACVFKPKVLVRDNWGSATRVSFPGTIVVNPSPVR